MGARGWKAYGYGNPVRTTRYTKRAKGGGTHVINVETKSLTEKNYALSHAKGGKSTKIGDYTTPQQAAEAADRLK